MFYFVSDYIAFVVVIQKLQATVCFMVLILDGHSKIGAHVRSNLYYHKICLGHLLRPFFFSKRPIFLNACPTRSVLPSYINTMVCLQPEI